MKRTDHQCDLQRAVLEVKTAILRCRYLAMRLANVEMLKLYYGIGEYVANASRVGKWGTGAIVEISSRLQQELPGLRGFSETNIKSMRLISRLGVSLAVNLRNGSWRLPICRSPGMNREFGSCPSQWA